jgi:hypothetical protein
MVHAPRVGEELQVPRAPMTPQQAARGGLTPAPRALLTKKLPCRSRAGEFEGAIEASLTVHIAANEAAIARWIVRNLGPRLATMAPAAAAIGGVARPRGRRAQLPVRPHDRTSAPRPCRPACAHA